MRIVSAVLAALLVTAAALAVGARLKRGSDAYRAGREWESWQVDERVPPLRPVSVPPVRACRIEPGASVSRMRDAYEGILLSLSCPESGNLPVFPTPTTERAGLEAGNGTGAETEVARLHAAGFRVTGVFAVTSACFSDADPGARAYERGLQTALLCDYAAAGFDDLLLCGLPCGDDRSDREAVSFLRDVKALFSEMSSPPALGVALPPSVFALGGEALETETEGKDDGKTSGEVPSTRSVGLTPARLATVSDYLAMDLRCLTDSEIHDQLRSFSYAYARFSLRLLLPAAEANDHDVPSAAEDALSHGFTRLFEW